MPVKITFKKIGVKELKYGDIFFNTQMDAETWEKKLSEEAGMSVFVRGKKVLAEGDSDYAKVWKLKITNSRKKE